MGKTKAQYADELIESLERTKQGGWVSWIDEPTKDAVIEVCQNVIESWCGRGIDHVKPHERRYNLADVLKAENYDRAKILLKATLDLLRKQVNNPLVVNILNEKAIWDDAECDGWCLLSEIEDWLLDVKGIRK